MITNLVQRAAEFRRHPLGFFYLQERATEGVMYRVHVWLPDDKAVMDNDRHQHAYMLNSRVKIGRLKNELFRFRETADGPEKEFLVTYEKARSKLSPTGRIGSLDCIAVFETTAGSSYILEAGVIHRVNVLHRPCVTFVQTTDRRIEIFSYGTAEEEAPFDRNLATLADIKRLELVLAELR